MANGFDPRKPHNRPQRGRAPAGVDRSANAAQLLREAKTAFYREEEEEALDLLLEVLHLAPQNLHAHYLAALCADLLSEEETLEDVCAHALEVDPRHPYAIACEGVRYLFLSNFQHADDLFAKALSMLPTDLDLCLGLGILHEYSGDDARSLEAFRRALNIDSHNVRARVSVGMAYAMSGEYQSALAEYLAAKEIDPSIENPHQRLGRDYYLDGAIEEAACEFGQAVGEEPDEPAAYFYLMDCYNRLSRCDDALDMYETIRDKFGSDSELTAGFFEYFHMHREATVAFEQLAEKYPEDAEARFRLSQVYHEAGRSDDAVKAAQAAVDLEPDNPHFLALLGKLYFGQGEYLRAVSTCRRAVDENRYDQAAYITMADALLFLGRDQQSQATIEEMERNREEAWRRYQDKFSGQDRADTGR
jgi:tetratricopeptide (TPR) repeat protein